MLLIFEAFRISNFQLYVSLLNQPHPLFKYWLKLWVVRKVILSWYDKLKIVDMSLAVV